MADPQFQFYPQIGADGMPLTPTNHDNNDGNAGGNGGEDQNMYGDAGVFMGAGTPGR